MGFFDKLKSMKNAITGGGAKVYVETEGLDLEEAFDVTIKTQVSDANLKVNRVYLLVEAIEDIEIPDVDMTYDEDGESERRTEIVRKQTPTLQLEIPVAGAGELQANQQYEWTTTVQMPNHALEPYDGKYCRHYYRMQAGLDCFGNDPDSGWIELSY